MRYHKQYAKRAIELINSPLHPVNRVFEKNGRSGYPPLFIISSPRSGSTLLYELMAHYFDVSYMTAPLAYTYGISNLSARILKHLLRQPSAEFQSEYGKIRGIFSPSEHTYYWNKWLPEKTDKGHYYAPEDINNNDYVVLRRSIASLSNITENPWIFKNLYLSISAGALSQIIPDARFLILHRDPLFVVQSVMRGREIKSKGQWWSVKPPDYRSWVNLPIWQQVTRQVFYADRIPTVELRSLASERTFEVEYNDLCKDPRYILKTLEEWLRPLGYHKRNQVHIPLHFNVSNNLHISMLEKDNIREEINYLEASFDESHFQANLR